MSVIGVNIVSFLVVCCQAFADRVCVGAQSTFKDVIFTLWLSTDIVVLDAVVASDPFPCGAEVLAKLTLENGVFLWLIDG